MHKCKCKMALINTSSLVNKTFILNDFTAQTLDCLCVTETWIKPGESCPLVEPLPQGCSFLNTPCLCGRDGGLVTVFKNTFPCGSLSTAQYSSFEVQLFQILLANPVTIALVYRPPKQDMEFLNEFTAFVGDLVTAYDKILLLGDFNIHVCCASETLSMEFLKSYGVI